MIMVQTLPNSITQQRVADLVFRLSKIRSAFTDPPALFGSATAFLHEDHNLQDMTLVARRIADRAAEYQRFFELAYTSLGLAAKLPAAGEDFDKNASTLMYLYAKSDRLYNWPKQESDRSLRTSLIAEAATSAYAATVLRLLNHPEPRWDAIDFGIVTVLDHEFQSIVRRLDELWALTEDNCYGFTILDRTHPHDDPKSSQSRPKNYGWAYGKLGAATVFVLCVGPSSNTQSTGKNRVLNAVAQVRTQLKAEPMLWVMNGVCAGSNRDWPIGTVLVAREFVGDIIRKKSEASESGLALVCSVAHEPSDQFQTSGTSFPMRTLFRPRPCPDLNCADPSAVPAYSVPFACCDETLNGETVVEEIRAALSNAKLLALEGHFGAEMEGTGLAKLAGSFAIVKSVCDYGDRSKREWSSEKKMIYQLFAAETAADFLAEGIRGLNVVDLRTKQNSNPLKTEPTYGT